MPELQTSAHWRDRAEDARVHAAEMLDPDSRRMMLVVASNYDKLAAYTEKLERERLARTARNSD
jgi:hypothetical protein